MDELFNTGFTPNSYLNIIKLFTTNIYKEIPLKKPKDGLLFNYKINPSVNACAYVRTTHDCIDINTGTVVYIFAYMKTALADQNVLADLGDSSKETNEAIRGGFDKLTKQLFFSGKPIDDLRDNIATYLSILSIRYIAMHEMGHLFNGHLGLLNDAYAIEQSEMITKFKCDIEGYALDRRAMEMDADAFAATNCMINIIEIYKMKGTSEWQKLLPNMPTDDNLFRLFSFALHSVFLIFEGLTETSYSSQSYYLPNEARAMLAFNSALRVFESWKKYKALDIDATENNQISQRILEGILEAESFFNRKFGKNYNYLEQTTNNPTFTSFSDEVLNHWDNNLEKRLQKYSRAALYNPKTIDKVTRRMAKKSRKGKI